MPVHRPPCTTGTKCGGLLSDFRSLNQRLRQEARATFKEFEASISRDSNKHVVTVRTLGCYGSANAQRLKWSDLHRHVPGLKTLAATMSGCFHTDVGPKFFWHVCFILLTDGHDRSSNLVSWQFSDIKYLRSVLPKANKFLSRMLDLLQDGTVHPLAAYTLGFLKRLFTYESSVLVLFSDAPDAPPGTRQCAPLSCPRLLWADTCHECTVTQCRSS